MNFFDNVVIYAVLINKNNLLNALLKESNQSILIIQSLSYK